MSKLMNCGVCCSIISLWGIIQLLLLGIFFKLEAVPLTHDGVAKTGFADLKGFLDMTKQNYAALGRNCFLTAAVYSLTLALSLLCIRKARKAEKKMAAQMEDEEYSCSPKEPKKKQKKTKV